MSTDAPDRTSGAANKEDSVPVVDPKAPVTNEQLEVVVQGIGGLMDKALKTAATEFETIVKESVKQMGATLEQHANAINSQNEVIKKIVDRLNGGAPASSEGGTSLTVGKSQINLDEIKGLLELATQAKAVIKGEQESSSEIDNIARVLGKGMINEAAKNAIKQIRFLYRKGSLTDTDVEGLLDTKVADHATIK